MQKEKLSKKDKIIQAALKIIAKKGNMNFTIREVILDAEVNVASVNYYFGTKKKLIQEIEKKFMQALLEFQTILTNPQIPPKKRLVQWTETIIEAILKNPGIVLIFSNKLIMTEQFDETVELFFLKNNQYLNKLIKELTGIEDEEQLQLKIVQFNAELFFPMLFIKNSKKIFGFSIQEDAMRSKYVKSVIDSILY